MNYPRPDKFDESGSWLNEVKERWSPNQTLDLCGEIKKNFFFCLRPEYKLLYSTERQILPS